MNDYYCLLLFDSIMMLSVLKNTKTPVKFWFLKNYLSPTFKVSYLVFEKENMLIKEIFAVQYAVYCFYFICVFKNFFLLLGY